MTATDAVPGPDASPADGARTVAWFHCFAGIAGDMALGSLLDAGADLDEVRALLDRLPIDGWRLDTEPVLRGGIAACRAVVTVTDNVVIRTYSHIVGLVSEARLPPRVTQRALATFAALAEVEARLHRRSVEHVHFHEVGGHDAVVDIVGTAAALEVLGVDEVRASPVATGTGMVRTAHGLLPNPAPAVVSLLEGAPLWGRNLAVELTTPTGAALLAALSSGYGPMPAMRVTTQGFGAGSRDIDELPNCTQVVLGVAVDRRLGTVPTLSLPPRTHLPPPYRLLVLRRRRSPTSTRGAFSTPTPTPTPASQWCCWRRTSTTPPASSSPTPWPPCSRRVRSTSGSPPSS